MATTYYHTHAERKVGMRPVAVRYYGGEKVGAVVRFMRPVAPTSRLVSVHGKTTARELLASEGFGKV